ncbi:MAG: T9SS type A sorting domain-containing protein, partial [Bacteroidetes bacterium]|nr:T9SS type A sorting domain-containing protein [Bacteroidota bacterium]
PTDNHIFTHDFFASLLVKTLLLKKNYFSEGTQTLIAFFESNTVLQVFPIPADDYLNVEANGSFLGQMLDLYDVKGKLVFSTNVSGKTKVRINISYLAAGNYLLSLIDNGIMIGQRLVIIKR